MKKTISNLTDEEKEELYQEFKSRMEKEELYQEFKSRMENEKCTPNRTMCMAENKAYMDDLYSTFNYVEYLGLLLLGDARHWATSKNFRLPIFQTEKEAKRLRLKMECEILCRMFKKNGQRCITVKELYDYAEVKNIGNIPKELETHGWSVYDILEAKIIPYSEGIGYVIDLPHPSLLNNSDEKANEKDSIR